MKVVLLKAESNVARKCIASIPLYLRMDTLESKKEDYIENIPDDETVANLSDIVDVFDLMDTYDISTSDLDSFDELLERINLHVWSRKNGNYKQMVKKPS